MKLEVIVMLLLMLRYTQLIIASSQCVLQYIVSGRGYTFTRHNNKLTMNINSNIFFDDSPVTSFQAFPKRPIPRRQEPLPPIKNSKEQK